jgi:hypothetical protein
VGAGEMGGSAAGGSELPLAPRATGAGMTCGGSDAAAFAASVFAAAAPAATAGDEAERPAVDGVETGPVSREQPEAQPVAAGPVKVGVYRPRLDDVTALVRALVVALVTGAAAAPMGAMASATTSDSADSRDSSATFPRMNLSLTGSA